MINYEAPATVKKMMESEAIIRLIIGPIGSGKSVGAAVELFRRACAQQSDARGIRPTKFVVIRNTYGELDDTTIPTFMEWFADSGKWHKTARTFVMDFELPDKTRVVSTWLFRALDKPKDVRKVKSLEITGAWINEAREVPMDIIINVASRRGRFPSRNKRVPATWAGVVMDSQPPDRSSDHYKMIMNAGRFGIRKNEHESDRPIFELFRQPSGTSPAAENVKNLPPNYYKDQMAFARISGKSDDWINVHIHGEYGYLPNGVPVYGRHFKPAIHVSRETLDIIPGRTIGLGYDPGLVRSAVAIGQLTEDDQWRIYREIIGDNVAVGEMVQRVKMALVELGVRHEAVLWYCDPAAFTRNAVDKKAPVDIIKSYGYRAIKSEKGIEVRIGAVRGLLNSPLLPDGRARLVIDHGCENIIEGMLGGYIFKNIQTNEGRVRQLPEKGTLFSEAQDAVQYLVAPYELARQKGHKRQWPGGEQEQQRRRYEPEVKPGSFNPHTLFQ